MFLFAVSDIWSYNGWIQRAESALFLYFLWYNIYYLHVSYLKSCKLILRSLRRSGWRQSRDRVGGLRPCLVRAAISSGARTLAWVLCSEWAELGQGGRGLRDECSAHCSAQIWDVKDTREHIPSHFTRPHGRHRGFLTGGKDQWAREVQTVFNWLNQQSVFQLKNVDFLTRNWRDLFEVVCICSLQQIFKLAEIRNRDHFRNATWSNVPCWDKSLA